MRLVMQIWYFNNFWTVVLDFAAWLTIHMGSAYFITMVPLRLFNPESIIFQERSWEKKGDVYQKYFQVKVWKKKLPDGAVLFKKGFRKKIIANKNPLYFEEFLIETCRAEIAHWIVLATAPLFFLWNPVWAGYLNITYALIVNLPCIITQRYNRPHFSRLVSKSKHKKYC
jgi:glycosyl-4,4'-diaponeurosporenoate acyltransferase